MSDGKCIPYLSILIYVSAMIISLAKCLDAPLSLLRHRPQNRKGPHLSRYKKAPRKVVWYFPITPHMQRYFVYPKEANLMRWHAERKKPDDGDDPKLRHLADAS